KSVGKRSAAVCGAPAAAIGASGTLRCFTTAWHSGVLRLVLRTQPRSRGSAEMRPCVSGRSLCSGMGDGQGLRFAKTINPGRYYETKGNSSLAGRFEGGQRRHLHGEWRPLADPILVQHTL